MQFEFLKQVPETLESGEVFYLPYRIVAQRDFDPAEDGDASGGGCGSYNGQVQVSYQSQCANGAVVPGGTSTNFNSNWGSCSGGGGSGSSGGGGSSSYYYGGPSGGGSGYAPRTSAITGGGEFCPTASQQGYCAECNGDNPAN